MKTLAFYQDNWNHFRRQQELAAQELQRARESALNLIRTSDMTDEEKWFFELSINHRCQHSDPRPYLTSIEKRFRK